jgi:hypothetical protein
MKLDWQTADEARKWKEGSVVLIKTPCGSIYFDFRYGISHWFRPDWIGSQYGETDFYALLEPPKIRKSNGNCLKKIT